VAKLTRLKTDESGFIERKAILFTFSIPERRCSVPTLLSRTKQDMQFDEGPGTLGLTEKDIKE